MGSPRLDVIVGYSYKLSHELNATHGDRIRRSLTMLGMSNNWTLIQSVHVILHLPTFTLSSTSTTWGQSVSTPSLATLNRSVTITTEVTRVDNDNVWTSLSLSKDQVSIRSLYIVTGSTVNVRVVYMYIKKIGLDLCHIYSHLVRFRKANYFLWPYCPNIVRLRKPKPLPQALHSSLGCGTPAS